MPNRDEPIDSLLEFFRREFSKKEGLRFDITFVLALLALIAVVGLHPLIGMIDVSFGGYVFQVSTILFVALLFAGIGMMVKWLFYKNHMKFNIIEDAIWVLQYSRMSHKGIDLTEIVKMIPYVIQEPDKRKWWIEINHELVHIAKSMRIDLIKYRGLDFEKYLEKYPDQFIGAEEGDSPEKRATLPDRVGRMPVSCFPCSQNLFVQN